MYTETMKTTENASHSTLKTVLNILKFPIVALLKAVRVVLYYLFLTFSSFAHFIFGFLVIGGAVLLLVVAFQYFISDAEVNMNMLKSGAISLTVGLVASFIYEGIVYFLGGELEE